MRTYTINPTTGAATAVGGQVALPVPAMAWDINFNPTVDRIRIVNDQDENAGSTRTSARWPPTTPI